MASTTRRNDRGFDFWATLAIGTVIAVLGVPILVLAGGIWLATLGGSWYYIFGGAGLIVTAYFLFRRSTLAVWAYLLTFCGTVVWALWEAGLDGWAQVPRLVAPTVVLLLVLATIPALRWSRGRRGGVLAGATGAAAAVAALAILGSAGDDAAFAQSDAVPGMAQPAPRAGTTAGPPSPTAQALPKPPQVQSSAEAEEAVSPTGVAVAGARAVPTAGADRVAYGGDNRATRFSPLGQITRENVVELELAWTFRTGDMPEGDERFSNQNTPLKIGDRVLVCSAMNKIIALDAAREVRWDRPFGSARENGPFGLPSFLPFTIGTPNNAGAVVTSTGLIFIAATTDDHIRAIDIEPGEELWKSDLPAGGQAGPAMYEADGRQFLIINAAGHNFMETPIGDYFLAFASPRS